MSAVTTMTASRRRGLCCPPSQLSKRVVGLPGSGMATQATP